jgi:uncharacterized membrane protein
MAGANTVAAVALIVHALAAVVWVGGMFFAHQALRPAAVVLDPGPRLLLWSRVLGRFFAWVIAAIGLLLVSGYAMVLSAFGGFGGIGFYVQLMMGIGILMMLLFFHLYFAPWRRFRAAVARQDWAEGGRQLSQIRTIVAVNLVLGLIVVAIGSSGRYWG